ncbi:MAG: hypothetical protein DHS20C16_30970 [Phycisphaerae bacterium]|nr:MAG: hypothetical protein DHS20C16_30970 [Phycisphaerae bacterium]
MPDQHQSTSKSQRHPAALWVFLAIIVFALGGTVYMMRKAEARTQSVDKATKEKAIPVEVFVVRNRNVPQIIEARGFLSGVDELSLHSEVDGKVVSHSLEDGAKTEAGDVLIKIDDTFYALAVKQAKAELNRSIALSGEALAATQQAEAQLEAAKARQSNAKVELERIERMRETGASPPIEYQRTATALDTASADLRAAEASKVRFSNQLAVAKAAVAIAQVAHDNAAARLERCVIRAPISARVNRFHIEPGELATASIPLVELVRLDQMKILVELSGSDIGLVDLLTKAEVSIDSAPDRVYVGRLHHVAPKMDPVSRKFQVEILVDNPDETLLSGMFGQVKLYCGELTDALTIPRSAIFKQYGADHCHVVSDEEGQLISRLRRVEVDSVRSHLDKVQVISGLAEGERIILSRRRDVRDGASIAVGRLHDPNTLARN